MLPIETLKDILLKSGFIKEEDFKLALKASEEMDQEITNILIFRGLINEETLGQLIADSYQTPYISIKNRIIQSEILALIPEKAARFYRLIPFETDETALKIGMENPKDIEAAEFVKKTSRKKLQIYYISPPDLTHALGQYKKNIKEAFEKIVDKNIKASMKLADLSKAAVDLPVVKILNTIIEYAASENASDIHIESWEYATVIRFRLDGILRDITKFPQEINPAIVARVKILSNLKIDEHRVPQDGRFKFKMDSEIIALRVSILPAFFGENIVLRLLPESSRPKSLEELGLTGRNLSIIKENIRQPHGMILATGPTGSGKTTTLYSILNILNTAAVNICTIEDPIEYSVKRVNQTQVNQQTGLTFASGLRSLLRHDPNIIMVGEIRDRETVEMAIHSSLTGHLVLSTIHTNNAAGTIPRFLDMGAEGFLVASTVNAIIAQRLVRKICKACIAKVEPIPEVLAWVKKQLNKEIKIDFYKGTGCGECGNTGYRGRIGIYEVLEIDSNIRQLIPSKVSSESLEEMARKNGMISLFEDGLNKIGSGITTIEEVLRVVRE